MTDRSGLSSGLIGRAPARVSRVKMKSQVSLMLIETYP